MPVSNVEISANGHIDLTIGVTLSIFTIFGLPGNILAFLHFSRRASRNTNSQFFNRIYCTKSLVDCLICSIQFPIIQAVTEGRQSSSLLFHDVLFCDIWTILTTTFLMLSVFLVMFLSISRLLLIRFPHIKLHPAITVLCPSVYSAIIVIGLFVVPIMTGYVAITYNPNKAVCAMYGSLPGFNYEAINSSTVLTRGLLQAEMGIKIAWTCVMATPVPIILITFTLSVFYLKWGKSKGNLTENAVKRHTDASITVVVFTLLYVVCNIPMLIYLGFVKHAINSWMTDTELDDGIPYKAQFDQLYSHQNDFERYYVWMVVFDLPTSLNSALNPFIYYWRMVPFRRFVQTGIHDLTVQSGSAEQRNHVQPETANSDHTRSQIERMRRATCTCTAEGGGQRSLSVIREENERRVPPPQQSEGVSSHSDIRANSTV